MSVNAYAPHLLVLPEDDANKDIANGFLLDSRVWPRKIQVLPPAGGWSKTIDCVANDHAPGMQKFPERRLLLLIDFDNDVVNRLAIVSAKIPSAFSNRVYVLGVSSEPEMLRTACAKKLEPIGEALAGECAGNQQSLWAHPLLAHNGPELTRLIQDVKPFLLR
jgi:hypothetical protein